MNTTANMIEINIPDFHPTQENMEKLLRFIPKNDDPAASRLYGEFIPEFLKNSSIPIKINDYVAKRVDEYGGEGQGDDYWVVISFEKEGQVSYWKFQGHYASYYGSELDTVFEVKPEQKMVVVYEPVRD